MSEIDSATQQRVPLMRRGYLPNRGIFTYFLLGLGIQGLVGLLAAVVSMIVDAEVTYVSERLVVFTGGLASAFLYHVSHEPNTIWMLLVVVAAPVYIIALLFALRCRTLSIVTPAILRLLFIVSLSSTTLAFIWIYAYLRQV